MAKVTQATLDARGKWRHRGAARPAFAHAPGPGQESVWDYPRPPRLARDSRRIRVRHPQGALIADTRAAIRVLETGSAPTFYLPPEDVQTQRLRTSARRTFCEWKGTATEFDLPDVPGAAWAYLEPFPECAAIAGFIAFYPAKVSCFVDDERAQPQAGGYYGGWVTAEIAGPCKGEPGSADW